MITGNALCPEVAFDPEAHAYYVGGVRLASVTQVLGASGIDDVSRFTEAHRELGRLRHLVCELDDLQDLDESSVAGELIPALTAWRRFRAESAFTPTHVELRLFHPHGYCGTLDRVGIFGDKQDLILVDIKGSSVLRSTALQTAAYSMAFRHVAGVGIARRLSVHLKPDGTYEAIEYTDHARDLAGWSGALALYNWRQHGRNGNGGR